MMKKIILLILLTVIPSACAAVPTPMPVVAARETVVSTPTALAEKESVPPTATVQEEVDEMFTPTPRPTLAPDAWMELPIVPEVSEYVAEIFAKGQALGNRPDVFIKIGDSNSTTTWFLGPLGRGEYSLGEEYAYLQPAIDTFQESFLRNSVTVKRGANASSVFSPLWADREQCESKEIPLDCELRIMQPSYALVMLGTNDVTRLDQFEPNMRQIIETLIKAGVVPILSTKADNLEGDYSVNATITRLAAEYQIPLWNLWKALQPLENHGALPDDEAHLTWSGCHFDDPRSMKTGLAWRNLTALQTINEVWQGVQP